MQTTHPSPPRPGRIASWMVAAAALVLVFSAARLRLDREPGDELSPPDPTPNASGSALGLEAGTAPDSARLYHGRPLPEWLSDLCSSNAAAVETAQEVLSKAAMESGVVVHALVGCLFSVDPEARVQTLQCMGMIPDKPQGLVADIVRCLSDPQPAVRAEAAVALGSFQMMALEAVPALKQMASDDPDETVRSRAKDALYNIRIYNETPFESTPLIRR